MHEHRQQQRSWRKHAPCGCLLLMFLVVLGVPVIGWIVWSAHAAALVEQQLAEIRAAGEPLEPADLDAFYAIPRGRADATQLWAEAARTFDSESFHAVAAAYPVIGEGPEIPPVGESWEQREAVEELLEKYADEMAKLHEAAAIGGYARFDRDFEEGIAMLLPNVQGLRACARMLTLEARVAAHHGDGAAAARSIHAIFACCRAVEEDPILISHLVRVALAGVAVNEVEWAVGAVEFSDTDLQLLREDLRSIRFQHSLERSLMGERVIGMLAFRDPGRFAADRDFPVAVRANNEDLAFYLSTMGKYLAASRKPFPEALTLAEQAGQDIHRVTGDSQWNRLRYVFTSLLLPAVDAVFEASARGTGNVAAADTALAIEQYRRVHGQLPQVLAELVPMILDAVPLDPMDGQPLRYAVSDTGYVLYSVGRNRIDDGGVVGEERLDEVFSVRIGATLGTAQKQEPQEPQ